MLKNFKYLIFSLTVLIILTFIKINLNITSITLGYEMGRLKSKESQLIKKRNSLRIELAKLKTKTSLQHFAKRHESDNN